MYFYFWLGWVNLRFDAMSSCDNVSVGDESSSTELAEVTAGIRVWADQCSQPRPLVRIGRTTPDDSGIKFLVVLSAF